MEGREERNKSDDDPEDTHPEPRTTSLHRVQ
jgi:hypothetical protein